MRWLPLLLVVVLKIGTLKTESIDFTRKNGRVDVMFPLGQSKGKDETLQVADKHIVNDNKMHEWMDSDLKFQPNDSAFRKIVNFDDNDDYESLDNAELPEDQFKSIDQLDDMQSTRFSNYLVKLLQRPGVWEAPLILVKDDQNNLEDRPFPLELDGFRGISKRARYYRRYPWKRQNSRQYSNMDYDPYNPCTPTKDDVFQLLVALHDARQGNKSRIVSFCNRKRPASAVYTNIRFLGRRRK